MTSFSVAGGHATVQFATRRSAEVALERGKSMGNTELAIGWLLPPASESTETAVVDSTTVQVPYPSNLTN